MLRSSHVLAPQEPTLAPSKRPKLRRSLSSNHIDFALKGLQVPDALTLPKLDNQTPLPLPRAPFISEGISRPSSPSGRSHFRGISMDAPQSTSYSSSANKNNSKLVKGTVRDISPMAMYTMLSETSTIQLDIELVKKLRLLLRNESARCAIFVSLSILIGRAYGVSSWSEGFLGNGGYTVLLTRLVEILEVEWR